MDSASLRSQLQSSISEASRRIEGVIDDAEAAAADIKAQARAEAEEESRRAISESVMRVATAVEPLAERVESLRVEAAALTHELESATLELAEQTRQATERAITPEPPQPVELKATEPATAPPPDEHHVAEHSESGAPPISYPGTGVPRATGDPPEEAVLRATQMAVAGSSRADIENTLREEFDLADATPVVNDILGA